ncbi:MAG: phosphoenolpyruvate carboxykinase (GTP) [Thermodesulfobacteriota bacterium]|nr:phosphoenolpyruvate carboxykinase (GTP) [Thermodesulfobacteriota bacterium]
MTVARVLKRRLDAENLKRLKVLDNAPLNELIADAILKFQPDSVFVSTGSPEDMHYIRTQAIREGEESPLIMPGHTIHYDGYEDQGRDPANTRFLVSGKTPLGPALNSIDTQEGLYEIDQVMNRIMRGKEMIVSFYSLGPLGTEFAIPCVQVTDSFYVAHSEDILYRQGYELFKTEKSKDDFFAFLHSAGALENGVSHEVDLRRIFIDLKKNFVYSANTQYAGNTVAAKKLAHRLAIRKAAREDWLSEHFLIAGIPSYEGTGTTYIAGAFPSWCGKTSTSMLFQIVGDDLAHVRKRDGKAYAANVEKGMFGVIKDVNPQDDPYIHELLVKPGEIIFSNVLDVRGRPYWQGMGDVRIPLRGRNHSGQWWQGKKDRKGKLIPVSHDNARFCVALEGIENYDPTQVVGLDGIVYGGRSSKRPMPVLQSYGWVQGVFYAASIESEPTAATVGGSSTKVIINPMANKEFVSIAIGRYLKNHIEFAKGLKETPKIFYVNYFLRDDSGNFMNTKMDKKVWIRWIERRIADKVGALATPIGFIPIYDDLAKLFKKELGEGYSRDQYELQFVTRVPELLEKLDIVEDFYHQETSDIPKEIFDMIKMHREVLLEAKDLYGDNISPSSFKAYDVPVSLTKPY